MKRRLCLVAALAVLGLSVPPASARKPKAAASQKEQQDQRDRRHDQCPEGSRTVVEEVVADDGGVEWHPRENTGALDK